jgi:D-alanyl-lipoteichoic acid acyltransferase DltB (MBOAT superfamily)
MLFNSYAFLFGFMPIMLAGYWAAGRIGGKAPIAWLSAVSIFFYAYWNPPFLLLLAASAAFNYGMSHQIGNASTERGKTWSFWLGIAGNLLLLGLFKYLGPSLAFLHHAGFSRLPTADIVLPLGISFWTFTQIGYLVDRRDGLSSELKPLDYSLFVNFFPHLIAGPILHVREIGPQIVQPTLARLRAESFAPGLTIFAIGLAKKVLIADPLSQLPNSGYLNAAHVDLIGGWITMLSYSMQLYFDFSGYSDMAIGLAAMVGFRFPLNFNSPYKSRSVIEYWQRWHMTLTRYLNLLLFNPLALAITRSRLARGLKVSNKAMKSPIAFLEILVVPTFYTFLLAGIWHGAGFHYVIFGLLQAIYICVNHGWRVFGPQPVRGAVARPLWLVASVVGTYLAAIFSQTFFRAQSSRQALDLIVGALGFRGIQLPDIWRGALAGISPNFISFGKAPDIYMVGLMIGAMAVVWTMPNSQQIMGRFAPVLDEVKETGIKGLRWQPNLAWAVFTAVLLWMAVFNLNQATTFIYFQF